MCYYDYDYHYNYGMDLLVYSEIFPLNPKRLTLLYTSHWFPLVHRLYFQPQLHSRSLHSTPRSKEKKTTEYASQDKSPDIWSDSRLCTSGQNHRFFLFSLFCYPRCFSCWLCRPCMSIKIYYAKIFPIPNLRLKI